MILDGKIMVFSIIIFISTGIMGCFGVKEDPPRMPVYSFDSEINPETDVLIIEVKGAETEWALYSVQVISGSNGGIIVLNTESNLISQKGHEVEFMDDENNWDPVIGDVWEIRIVDNSNNGCIYLKEISVL